MFSVLWWLLVVFLGIFCAKGKVYSHNMQTFHILFSKKPHKRPKKPIFMHFSGTIGLPPLYSTRFSDTFCTFAKRLEIQSL